MQECYSECKMQECYSERASIGLLSKKNSKVVDLLANHIQNVFLSTNPYAIFVGHLKKVLFYLCVLWVTANNPIWKVFIFCRLLMTLIVKAWHKFNGLLANNPI